MTFSKPGYLFEQCSNTSEDKNLHDCSAACYKQSHVTNFSGVSKDKCDTCIQNAFNEKYQDTSYKASIWCKRKCFYIYPLFENRSKVVFDRLDILVLYS